MKHHYFEIIDDTQLPDLIKESFEDEFEMAHLRHINGQLYLVLNFPSLEQSDRTICIQADDKELNLYAPVTLKDLLDNFNSLTEILMGIVTHYEIITKGIYKKVESYESNVESLVDKDHVLGLYQLQKQMIIIESEVQSLDNILTTIRDSHSKGLYREEDLTDYASIFIETNQISSNIKVYRMMIETLLNSSESLFSNSLNETMKRLTSITLIFSVPIFMTGFFGMNIDIPGQRHPLILLFILVSSTVLMWIATIYMKKKDLL